MRMRNPYDAKDVADSLLEDCDDVCRSLNIPHFLFGGTCLGFYRDKGYIEFDTDIDVGVLCTPEELEELLQALTKKGIRRGGRLTCNINLKRDGLMLDVCFKFGPLHQAYLNKFDTVTYEGRTYDVPSPIKDYLGFTYFNWRTPTLPLAKGRKGERLGKIKPSAIWWPPGASEENPKSGPILL